MSTNWAEDIRLMHEHYGHKEAVKGMNPEQLKNLLRFRIDFLREEMNELEDAFKTGNWEEIVDALTDLNVVSIGTLDIFNVDANAAWDEVLKANMAKKSGINPNRPNPTGLPDLLKPAGWEPPTHNGNHGSLTKIND